VRDLRRRMGVLLGSRVLDFIRGDSGDHDGRADHVGGAILTSGASRHGCFLAVKPNQPEDDGEYGVPDVALPNVALPIARGQCGCLTKNPQYARPLVCGHEREANGTKQDKRGDHRPTFSSPPTMPQAGPFDYGPKIQTETLPSIRLVALPKSVGQRMSALPG
jgi:hypothetical protein